MVYGFFRPMSSYATLSSAQEEIKKLAEKAPKETFYICPTGKPHVFCSNPKMFTKDTLTVGDEKDKFSPDTESKKALRENQAIQAQEILDRHQELMKHDSLTDQTGTVEHYIKNRVLTTSLYETMMSKKQQAEEAEKKLSYALEMLMASENEEHLKSWAQVYNKKRRETNLPDHIDSLSFLEWINSQRTSRNMPTEL